MTKPPSNDGIPNIATKTMAAMVRMLPKPHEEMKLGKSKGSRGPTNKPRVAGAGNKWLGRFLLSGGAFDAANSRQPIRLEGRSIRLAQRD
jgi:hypothetical protein